MQELRQACLWDASTTRQSTPGILRSDIKVDVCVIGGGITGLSAALNLLEHGKSVAVLEAYQVGHGGSGRNAGLVNAGTWIRPDDVEAALGAQVGARLNKILGEAPTQVFATIKRLGIACNARNEGNLQMAHNASGVADLEARYSQWKRRGADVELLTGGKCQDYCGTPKIKAALLDRRAGTINPLGYTLGLSEAILKLGGEIFQHSAVTQLQKQDSGWLALTTTGSVRAEKIVISSGAYTEGDWLSMQKKYFRGYYYQVASEPLSGAESDNILKHGQGSWDTRKVLSSIRRDSQGRLVLGSLGRADNKPAWLIKKWADTIQGHYYPKLGKINWQMHWTGCIDFTPDHLMKIFEPADGIIGVTGYNGRGNTTGTVVGKAMAEYLLKGQTDNLPLPLKTAEAVDYSALRSALYEYGFTLYHAGQCLKVIA